MLESPLLSSSYLQSDAHMSNMIRTLSRSKVDSGCCAPSLMYHCSGQPWPSSTHNAL